MRTDEPNPVSGGLETITTREDLGRYLRELRDKRHVTQEGLAAHTGRKIARSRVSEIENARRDPVTERELRVYMMGLRCTLRDIEQVVTVLTRCTANPVTESPSDPDASRPPARDADPAGPGGVEDNPAPLEDKTDDDSAAATGKRNPGWKIGVAALTSVIVIVGVALFHTNAPSQSHPPTPSNTGLGRASAVNPSPFPTPSNGGLGGAIALNPSPFPTPSNGGLGALNSSPLPIQSNAGARDQKVPLPRTRSNTGGPNPPPPPTPPNAAVQNPPQAPVKPEVQSLPIPGDDSTFITDVTYQDNSPVRVNEQFSKTWEIQNIGSVVWQGRYLTRQTTQDAGRCTSSSSVLIPTTLPGHRVDISVTFTAPNSPGSCRVDWKMTNANGELFFPNRNPVYLLVNVIQ